jgi:DNA-binding beta-propeller fold protein YncE
MRVRQLGKGFRTALTALILMTGTVLFGTTLHAEGIKYLTDGASPEREVFGDVGGGGSGKIVVANRGSGTIDVISTATDESIGSYPLPAGDNSPEPMYVYATPNMRRVFVGDRANDRVVAFDSRTFEVVGMAETGRGVFHMWGSTALGHLWVNCDIDNTTAVIDMRTLETVATIPMPADLVALGGKPHDVIVSPDGFFGYVTLIGVDGESDYVVQFDARTFEEIGRAAVGDDPHVSLTPRTGNLYVPSQGGNAVYVLDRFTLEPVATIGVPGAHGAGMRVNGLYFYTANLPGGGVDALWLIDTRTNEIVGGPVDAPYSVPHNIALTSNGKKLYLTHSGPNDKVTIYRTTGDNPVPEYMGEVTVGMNPFGIAFTK